MYQEAFNTFLKDPIQSEVIDQVQGYVIENSFWEPISSGTNGSSTVLNNSNASEVTSSGAKTGVHNYFDDGDSLHCGVGGPHFIYRQKCGYFHSDKSGYVPESLEDSLKRVGGN